MTLLNNAAPVRLELPKPLPSGLPSVPGFLDALLPGALRPMVVDTSERMQCPPDYLGAGALIMLAGAVGRKARICPKAQDDWEVVPNPWGAIIGRPGVMKSPALDEMLKPLKRRDMKAAEAYSLEMEDFEVEKRLRSAMKSEMDKAIRKAAKEGRNPKAVIDEFMGGKEEPIRQRYIVQDPTVEALTEILAENPQGVLTYRDELSGLLMSLDKEGREDARAFYLEAWNGNGSFASDRIGRGHTFIPAVCISILGGIQPSRLRPYVRHAVQGGLGDDGLLQRFQVMVWPDPPKSWRNVDRWPDTQAREQVHDIVTRLSGFPMEETPRRFTNDAQELFNEWRTSLELRLRSGDIHNAMESHLSKYRKLMPAISLLLHLAENGDGAVSLESAEKAAAWCEYLEGHANRVYSVATDGAADAARLIARRLKKGDLESGFTARTLKRKGWAGLTDSKTVEEALELLEEHDWVHSDRIQTGGAPRTEYRVNPRVQEVEL